MSKQWSCFLYPVLLFIFFFNFIDISAKLDFTSESSSIVLKDSNAKVKFSNTTDLTGWNEQSVVQESIVNDLSIPNNTIYGEGGGSETSAPQNLLYNDSNAIANLGDGITENSNAIINNSNSIYTNAQNINYNSQAIVTNDNDINYNSQAIVTIDNDMDLVKLIAQNSAAIIGNSNALVTLDRSVTENSNAIVNNSWAIADLNNQIHENSWAIQNLIEHGEAIELVAQNSNAIFSASQSIITLDREIIENSNAIIQASNAIVTLNNYIEQNSNFIEDNSWAILALQDDITENSYAIVNNDEDISTNTNNINYNSQAIVDLNNQVGVLITENSNAIVNINEDIIENSSAIATNRSDIDSNDTDITAIQADVAENSSAIIRLQEESVENSNAIIDFTSTDYTPLITAITGETSIPHRSLMGSPIDLSGSTLTIHGDLLFSTETQITTSGSLSPLAHAFLLGGPLNIPDEVELKITTSGIIDGQGNTLHLGREAQLILDGGISVTLKNITIKNTHNSLARPPIKLIDWQTHLSLDEATIALNDDLALPVGQLFINNDVIFTGTSKFIYQSVSPSYITQHSSLFFDKEITFEYSPSSSTKNLINLIDNTSDIYFNGCTLQSTHTGIRLTTGRMFLDNKVTMSSMGEIQQLHDASYTFNRNILSAGTNLCKWSSDGRYFATAESDGTLKVYSTDELKNNPPSPTAIFDRDLGNQINSIDWSPDNKYIAMGTSTDELKIYELSNLKGNPAAPTAYFNRDLGTSGINHLEFSPSGKYVALARNNGYLTIYSLSSLSGNPTSPTPIFSQDVSSGATAITQIRWSPNGQYVMISENGGLLRIYEFTTLQGGGPYTPVHSSSRGATCITWNPEGEYIAMGFGPSLSDTTIQIYALSNLLGAGAYTPLFNQTIMQGNPESITSLQWSPNGNYISVGTSAMQGPAYMISMEFPPLLQNPNPPILIFQKSVGSGNIFGIDYSPQGKYLAGVTGAGQLVILENNYTANIKAQAFDSSIIFGNSAKGSNYNLNSFVLGGARVEVDGLAWFDEAN